MKLLMFLARHFAFRPHERVLPEALRVEPQAEAADVGGEVRLADVAVIFVHAEPQDEADTAGLETRFVKNVKWLAGKRGLKAVVLHSFTHLAEASASPQFAEAFLQRAAARLRNTGYTVTLTPFGWVCEWELAVFGESLAKVFKSL